MVKETPAQEYEDMFVRNESNPHKIGYETLTTWLNSIGLNELNSDPCLYICNNNVSMIFFHVNDLILVGPGNNFKVQFEKRFRNSSCHKPNTILGMKFEREGNKIKLSLRKHIDHGLEELGLKNCKPSITPLTPNLKLRDATDKEHFRFKKLNINYCSAIGLLNHIAQLTRPEISFAVKKVWQYLKGTSKMKLTLEIKKPNELLQIYSDASWGDDPQDQTSHSGYLSELNPLVEAFHEGIWLKALLADIWCIQLDAACHLIDDPKLN
ncbi:uncharacterized protein VP01_3998g2 [Puccinia sorghi]|uniref:Reverse transcriptase Ty1/copia-type domain-containing protein n=1 Tax=Puccinia sorghi TaxID=27349 RepID=A0A0L6US68_9BASI|nr:uncharacterized protein VP01_3998g2 [Puccinia sorghi]